MKKDCSRTDSIVNVNRRGIGTDNMIEITREYIKRKVAASEIVFERGQRIFENGNFMCAEADFENGVFVYNIDGNFGDYTTRLTFSRVGLEASCDCPYPNPGCKHAVAVSLDVRDKVLAWKKSRIAPGITREAAFTDYLNETEIRKQAIEDRKKRSKSETFRLTAGDMLKGDHLVKTPKGSQYLVTLHHPADGKGHCSCPDFQTSGLSTCKHMIFVAETLKREQGFKKRLESEKFPYVDIYWDSSADQPRMYNERPAKELKSVDRVLNEYFDKNGNYRKPDISDLVDFIAKTEGNKRIRINAGVLDRLNRFLENRQMNMMATGDLPSLEILNAKLYPYQIEGVKFGLYRKSVLIGDEMGLGKTLQAIALAILKKSVFDFQKVLVITMASLKEQWKREIKRFTGESAIDVTGNAAQRRAIYKDDASFFKITNYEAVLRDVLILRQFKPDLIILDEAQRIKNFSTKTADAVKSIPRRHAMVLTGTPLENKLEDVYSIVQFLDPHLLSPLWKFAADHYLLSRNKNGKILGYRNLGGLKEKLKPLVIRRKKEEVLDDLPDVVSNNYYLDLTTEQAEIHSGFARVLSSILSKKFLTPIDMRRITELLLCMRRVCDSTYLIDRETNISPKLTELEGILEELVLQNQRKVVIFSEWTTMTFLIGKRLSDAGIKFVELTGKIPVKDRHALIDEFTHNPDCKVFLSTDAGGTGLNLQAADCVINFELPWNPSKLNQRIGRVNRIGQKSRKVNVVNLISKFSIEEKIMAGIQLKTDLFEGVFDDGPDRVEFSGEKRNQLLNQLREMMGEEPEMPRIINRDADEIPEDTPHYLNPEVLGKDGDRILAYDEDISDDELIPLPSGQGVEPGGPGPGPDVFAAHPPERMEAVLNSGMAFIGGLLEMATGKKLTSSSGDDRMISIDGNTGEVTLKFKLPGFQGL